MVVRVHPGRLIMNIKDLYLLYTRDIILSEKLNDKLLDFACDYLLALIVGKEIVDFIKRL